MPKRLSKRTPELWEIKIYANRSDLTEIAETRSTSAIGEHVKLRPAW